MAEHYRGAPGMRDYVPPCGYGSKVWDAERPEGGVERGLELSALIGPDRFKTRGRHTVT